VSGWRRIKTGSRDRKRWYYEGMQIPKRLRILLKNHVHSPEASDEKLSEKPSTLQEIIVAAVVIVVLVAAAAGGVWFYMSSKDVKPAPVKDARGYTLTPPEGWKRITPTPDGASVAFAAPTADSDANGTLKAFIVVQSAQLNEQAKQTSFEEISKAYVSQLAQSYTDFQLVSTSSVKLADVPATMLTYTARSDAKTMVTIESVFTVKDGISYTVNGEALTSAWPQQSAQIEQSLLTFRP
jgi:flagellar basal body-associated protein FliL